jgi:predicted DNA-binding antitoxin AbrB/MazE fold protein
MISKTDGGRKWKNVNIEEGRKNCIKLRNGENRDTNMATKEYLESVCDEITKI